MLQKYLPLYGNYFVLFQKNTDFFFYWPRKFPIETMEINKEKTKNHSVAHYAEVNV